MLSVVRLSFSFSWSTDLPFFSLFVGRSCGYSYTGRYVANNMLIASSLLVSYAQGILYHSVGVITWFVCYWAWMAGFLGYWNGSGSWLWFIWSGPLPTNHCPSVSGAVVIRSVQFPCVECRVQSSPYLAFTGSHFFSFLVIIHEPALKRRFHISRVVSRDIGPCSMLRN